MAKRTDKNQAMIIAALRAAGCSVQSLHAVGQGFPDLCVGVPGLTLVGTFSHKEVVDALEGIQGLTMLSGANLLLEVKNPDTRGKLNARQRRWHEAWRGQRGVVSTVEMVLGLLHRL